MSKNDPTNPLWLLLDCPSHSDKELWKALNLYGILDESQVYIHYLIAKSTDIWEPKKIVEKHGKEILSSMDELAKLHNTHKPNSILAAGKLPTFVLYNSASVSNYRGSILSYNGRKLIPAYSPSSVEVEPSLYPIFAADTCRAIEESKSADFNYPTIDYRIDPKDDVLLSSLLEKEYLSVDIETTRSEDKELLCIGFGFGSTSVVLPFTKYNDNYIRNVLSSKSVRKIFHHGAFDVNVLMMKGYEVNAYDEDTIIQAQILEPELPRSLAFLSSIYTRLPYYKDEGRSNIPEDDKSWKASRSREELFLYNAKDVYVTYQIWLAQSKELKSENLDSLYRYEIKANHAAIELSQNGILFDKAKAAELKVTIEEKLKESYLVLARLTGKIINPRSSKDVPALLYDVLKLPVKTNKKQKRTTDEDAIVSLLGFCKNQLVKFKSEEKQYEWSKNTLILQIILQLRGLEKLLSSYINIKTSNDGRIRSVYKPHATETGRWAATKFIDDTGINLQTVPRGGI